MFFEPLFVLLIVPVIIILISLRIMREYERAVVFLLGRFWKVKGPGLIIIIPGLQTMVRVDLRPACSTCRRRT
jgi:regulator of protease activity HflC (stomatin/prohibitin superfamily)